MSGKAWLGGVISISASAASSYTRGCTVIPLHASDNCATAHQE